MIKSKKIIIPFAGLEQSRIIFKNVDILRGPLPTLLSKIKWLGSELSLTILKA